ncbi:hypothetical protein SAMN05421858_3775 [Haladaptatus litoreus]|uniref:Uncharacterized protein n=1 Tax=Haladaptatus litoreus TaxID=553468 RepID=A0A1N7DNB4_9EURY|nr:hypothetical protein SAMN05421858_3775 [Haladaptatus litoreus]
MGTFLQTLDCKCEREGTYYVPVNCIQALSPLPQGASAVRGE